MWTDRDRQRYSHSARPGWALRRRLVLIRDDFRCQWPALTDIALSAQLGICAASAREVDHIVPLSSGGRVVMVASA